jgi:hypothetical protein
MEKIKKIIERVCAREKQNEVNFKNIFEFDNHEFFYVV